MKFNKSILSPSYINNPQLDLTDSFEKSFVFDCVNCSAQIEVKAETIIGKEFGWQDDFDAETITTIKRFYDMNAVGKTPDGGQTAIATQCCLDCQTKYMIYAGVNEYANSAYKVTLQGINEITRR